MSLVLYHNPISTCSQKVRLALAEKNLPFESRVIDWSLQDHLSDWYLRLNPNGVVPTLVHDGEPVIDSSVICEYLDEVFPDPPIGPRDALGRARMRAWMRYSEEVPTPAIRVPSFNKLFARGLKAMPQESFASLTERLPLRKHFYREMGPEGFSPQATEAAMEKLSKCLRRMADALEKTDFLLGDYSIADILIIPTIVRLEDLGLSEMWADLPQIAAWFARVQARPSFAAAFYPGSRVDPNVYTLTVQDQPAC